MREQTQQSAETWRWIPNTGEYLVLENIQVKLKNKAGIPIEVGNSSSYVVKLEGLYDRGYTEEKRSME
jgi:hypothetical protein